MIGRTRTPRLPRALAAAWVIVASLMAQAPASAFTFTLFAGHEDQLVTWYSNGPNGQAWSVDGQIPFTGQVGLAGGELSWTASSGMLRVLAVPTCAARGTTPSSFLGRWGALDGRMVPLTFLLTRDTEPPGFTTDLYIRPRLLGTVEVLSAVQAGVAELTLQLRMAIQVNGEQVARDSLYLAMQNSGGQNTVFQVAFPKGAANYVVVPGVHEGSQIEITLWAFMYGIVQGVSTVDAYFTLGGPFYLGPGLMVDVLSPEAVAVAAPSSPARLSFSARPNPFPGSTRIHYGVPSAARVRLSIYDVAGHRVATPVERFESAGDGQAVWDGRDSRGASLPPGVYFAELAVGDQRTVGKLVILRH